MACHRKARPNGQYVVRHRWFWAMARTLGGRSATGSSDCDNADLFTSAAKKASNQDTAARGITAPPTSCPRLNRCQVVQLATPGKAREATASRFQPACVAQRRLPITHSCR